MCKEPRNLRSRRDIYEAKVKVARMQSIQQYEPWLWGNATAILHTNESTPWTDHTVCLDMRRAQIEACTST
ncbi:hypothetical protein HBH96_089500 [Parastagonospora nodorum]|nr:hypothetical protein HBH96_089500 [Parastagonospora nodorum]